MQRDEQQIVFKEEKTSSYRVKNKPLYQDLDEKWKSFSNDSNQEALAFLTYALNINPNLTKEEQERQIRALMEERYEYRNFYPEYIPGKCPPHLKRDPKKLNEPFWVGKAVKNHELLEVNQDEAESDRLYYTTMFTKPNARQPYRVMIYQGRFEREGISFDTSAMMAHGKKGYAAFTLNKYGELSVFEHHFGLDRIMHSTMNDGNAVIGAGELVIQDGKLIAINTYSGHYRPALYNVYRTLTYFESQGVDTSQVRIYLLKDSEEETSVGVEVKLAVLKELVPDREAVPIRYIAETLTEWYELEVQTFRQALQDDLKANIAKVKETLQSYRKDNFASTFFRAKDACLMKKEGLTSQRSKLAEQAMQQLNVIEVQVQEAASYMALDCARVQLKRTIRELKKTNNELSLGAGKGQDTGRLAKAAKACQAAMDFAVLERVKPRC
jgi:hypothetical protein